MSMLASRLASTFESLTMTRHTLLLECREVHEVCLLANPDIGQRLRVSKYGIRVIANSVRVFSTRSVTRPDWHMKFCQIILQKSCRPYDVSQQIDKAFNFESCLGNDCHSLRCVGGVRVLKYPAGSSSIY